jgi:hypothetical protein
VPVPEKGNGLFGGLSRHQKRVLKMQRQWAAKVTAETISLYTIVIIAFVAVSTGC